MAQFLFRIMGWLQWIGIVATSDIHRIPVRNPNALQLIAADFRVFFHVTLPLLILVPQVNIWQNSFIIIMTYKKNASTNVSDRLYVSSDCQSRANGTHRVSG